MFNSDYFFEIGSKLKEKDNICHFSEFGCFDNEVIESALISKNFSIKHLSIWEFLLLSGPFMIIITHNDHHISARRFEDGGRIWIFDSLANGPAYDSDNVEEKLIYNILKHFFDGQTQNAPQVLQVFKCDATVQFSEHELHLTYGFNNVISTCSIFKIPIKEILSSNLFDISNKLYCTLVELFTGRPRFISGFKGLVLGM